MDLIESYQPQGGITVLNATVSYLAEGPCPRQNAASARVTHESDAMSTVAVYYCPAKTMNHWHFILAGAALHAGHSELGVLSYKLFPGKELKHMKS